MTDKKLEFGIQPLDRLMEEAGLSNHDLVAASKDGLTHKQVRKGRKGRRLTRSVQEKIVRALSFCTATTYDLKSLFNY